jgi:hypothetical protein
MMTAENAAGIAEKEARRLAWPWDAAHVEARRRHPWPVRPFWVVVSQSTMPRCTTTVHVRERTRAAAAVGIVYHVHGERLPTSGARSRLLRLVAAASIAAVLAFVISTQIIGWPPAIGALVAAAWALLAPIVLASLLPAGDHDMPPVPLNTDDEP